VPDRRGAGDVAASHASASGRPGEPVNAVSSDTTGAGRATGASDPTGTGDTAWVSDTTGASDTTAAADTTEPGDTARTGDRASTQRLDAAVAARGLARSRTAAAALIQAGRVTVDGVPVVKASTPVTPASGITVDAEDEWVSRAALKLVAALDAFDVDPRGRTVLDVGASTGGFTQVLLSRGAARVVALDVGHGQLAPEIALDDRVAVVEGVNARNLTSGDYLALDPAAGDTSLVVGDLSFISLRMVLPALVEAVPADDFVLLVKPQFEVGRTGIREGIVRDPSLRQDALMNVLWAAWDLGFGTAGLAPSPIVGTHGNQEYLARLQRGRGENPTEWIVRATELAEGAP
jgi:TlyA family rRNA methyltransferase/putative hemolysin